MGSRTISTAAEEIFPRNVLRKSFIMSNEDSTDVVYIKRERAGTPAVSSSDHDHRIGPGGIISINSLTDGTESIQDRWTAVAGANTPRISFFETEDVKR